MIVFYKLYYLRTRVLSPPFVPACPAHSAANLSGSISLTLINSLCPTALTQGLIMPHTSSMKEQGEGEEGTGGDRRGRDNVADGEETREERGEGIET